MKNTQPIENFVFKGKRDALVGLSHLFLDKKTISSNTFLDFLDKNATRLKEKSKYSLGHMIHLTGMNAERKKLKFDYDKGLDLLLKYDKTGEYIFDAGDPRNGIIEGWSKFNYNKALKKLKQIGGKWHKKALKYWPKGIEQSIAKIRELEKTSRKLPMKKLKMNEMAIQPIPKGKFEEWAKKRTSGVLVSAGERNMPNFDYDRALEIIAGRNNEDGWNLVEIGKCWKNKIDYNKVFELLVKNTNEINFVYRMHQVESRWDLPKNFDYKKALSMLKKECDKKKWTGMFASYNALHKAWFPLKYQIAKTKQIEKTSRKLPMKKLKMGEDKMNFKKEVRYYLNEKKDADRVRGGYKAMATRLSNDLNRKISPAQVKKYLSSLEKTKAAKGIDKRAKGAVSSDAYKWSSKYKIMLGHFAKK